QVECGGAVALQQGEVEDFEVGAVDLGEVVEQKAFFIFFRQQFDEVHEARVRNHCRKFISQGGPHARHGKRYLLHVGTRKVVHLIEAVDGFFFTVERIEAALIGNEQVNGQAGRQADGEAEDVDERVQLILADVAQGNSEVVFQHGGVGYRQ